jgi:hypothetical protein
VDRLVGSTGGRGRIPIEVLRDFGCCLIDALAAECARGLRTPAVDAPRAPSTCRAVELLQRLRDAARALGTVVGEIDLNPVLVGRRGEGVTILDALVRR